ncbi:putative bifunctional diguanylate cyclase/phosphodiesterase [Aestuariibius sp. 2305UL40-4]|uniref:putative bifunctional diguanylate cyclase/phosphodiesterase n=1 Tax=Aestuariibius violaceus TaxID=3234132 RepID=UPI00345E2987
MAFLRRHVGTILLIAMALVLFVVSAELEAFEEFYEYSRNHEEYDLDEVFTFFVCTAIFLPIHMWRSNRRLRRAFCEKRNAEAEATHIALHDVLTGLRNRRFLSELIARWDPRDRRRKQDLSVLLIDLDRFKPINDLRGHEAGDAILREVANRIRGVCDDGMVAARLGGDEFAIVHDAAESHRDTETVARDLLHRLSQPYSFGDWSAVVTCSVGIASAEIGGDASDLLRRADQAMYRAKAAGRATYGFYDDALGEELRDKAELEADLRASIQNNALEPYFQPIVDIECESVIGLEVLARWKHPTRGFISPEIFVRMAEEIGMIDKFSDQMLEKACDAARRWSNAISLSFNLSPSQFDDESLPSRISEILAETGFPPHRLEIEITEQAIVVDMDRAREVIDALRKTGVRLSLDDFGTGASSLATLAQLPFDRLKIDRSFVSDIVDHTDNAKIVRGVLALAGSLDLSVTAEGIEHAEELAFLRDLDCSYGQGYLFSKPLPASEIAETLLDLGTFAKDAQSETASAEDRKRA